MFAIRHRQYNFDIKIFMNAFIKHVYYKIWIVNKTNLI